jgi:hypothetical protein
MLHTILVSTHAMQDLRSEHVTLLLNRIVGTGKHNKKKSKFDTASKRNKVNNKESNSEISVRQFITWVRTRQVSCKRNTCQHTDIVTALCKAVCLCVMQPLHVLCM